MNTNNVIIESDINLNSYYSFANSAQTGCYDTWPVFLHEPGHTARLGHLTSSSAVMTPTISTNFTKR